MPLSDREQRILEEIEKNLYEEDPRFARATRRATPRFDRSKRARLGGLLFVIGLGTLLVFFVTQLVVVGVLAFGGMVAGIVLVLGSSSTLVNSGREGGRDATARFRGSLKNFEQRIRNRNKRI
ncbi:MAG TPA: DUF3040 domain-containing protein [Actinomycetota bacterium]|nr:DUF3040 domain-containing protein [Actinomycetota bacterium]